MFADMLTKPGGMQLHYEFVNNIFGRINCESNLNTSEENGKMVEDRTI